MNYKFLTFLAVIGLVISCSEDQPDVSSVTRFAPFDVMGIPDQIVVDEGDTTLVLDFTFDDNQIYDVELGVAAGAGTTATEGVDFSISNSSVSVATLAKQGSVSVTIASDLLTEGDESIFLTLTDQTGLGYPNTKVVEIVIKDVVNPNVFVTIDWDGVFLFDGDAYTWCQFVDMDVLLQDAAGADLGIYPAATGACPETIPASALEDGEYYMAGYLYSLGPLNGLGITDSIPFTINAFKQNEFDVSFTPEGAFTAVDGDQATDGNNEFKNLGRIVVSGGTVEIYDDSDALVASGLKEADVVDKF